MFKDIHPTNARELLTGLYSKRIPFADLTKDFFGQLHPLLELDILSTPFSNFPLRTTLCAKMVSKLVIWRLCINYEVPTHKDVRSQYKLRSVFSMLRLRVVD